MARQFVNAPTEPVKYQIGKKIVTFLSFGKGRKTIKAKDSEGNIVAGPAKLFKTYKPPVPDVVNDSLSETERLQILKSNWGKA